MPGKPNIIIFNPDQWRGDVLGHLGNEAAVTPRLDQAVGEDFVSFRSAFCQNPVCTPSRCSFMSGWYPHVHGHRTMFHMLRNQHGQPNLLQVLKENGYFVWWGGKNDLVPGQDGYEDHCHVKFQPSKEDFVRWGHKSRPMWSVDRQAEWRGQPDSDTYYSFYVGELDKGEDDIYCDADWANVLGAVDFIRNAPPDKPFCLFLPLTYPHPPYAVEEPWYGMIGRSKLPPRTPCPDWECKPSLLRGIYERQNLSGWDEERWTKLRAVYYGMCARVDHQFGLMMDALRETGRYDDTAVFLFADHGDFTGDYGLVEKTQNTFEDCLSRVPFLVKPPAGTPCQPRVSDALVELVDFPATVYDLAGIDPGYDHFGKSLLPLLAGETDEHRDAVFCEGGRLRGETQAMELDSHQSSDGLYWPRVGLQTTDDAPYHSKAVMCRTKQFKYVRRLYEKDELYDLEKDSAELYNVVDDPAYRDVLLKLKDRLLTFYVETVDVVPRETDKRW